jgi:hypothetical protein
MLLQFHICILFFLILNINYISSKESREQNNNKKYIKNIIKSMNLFQGNFLSFLEENNDEQKASTWLTKKVGELLRREVGPFIQNRTKNVSESCKQTLYKYLINNISDNENNNISEYHIRKFFEGASKHKNDLSTYDICMYNNFRIRTESNKNEFADSIYFILTLDNSNLTINGTDLYYYTKANADVENILYIRSFCFPQEIINGTESCSDDDYFHFLMEVNSDLNDLMELENIKDITYFSLKKKNYSPGEYFVKIIPFILILIQFILVFFRQIIKLCINCCCFKKNEKINILINDPDSNDGDAKNKRGSLDESISIVKTKKVKKAIEYPKWLKIYFKCFNLTENFKELYNFSLNSTEINNDSGLTYIRGLKSFSLIFLIFGLTYFTFINSFSKTYSKFLLNEFLKYPFFMLFFIGLRYSPRIIFSCSGYTLSFKYLSYIQKNSSVFGIFKFVIYQIYKYIMLFWFFLFQRYSLFLLSTSGEISRPMYTYFEKNILSKPDGGMFLISFLDLTTIYTRDGNKRIDQTLIDYFWLPFNEMLFFVVGVLLISIGYKCKFRIDILILVLILINIIVKIIFSYLKKTMEGESYYATLYYYLFDYGKFMIHPIFNLPYYLIGMYFGLINYSVQKGITSIEVSNTSQDNAMINLQNMFTGENVNTEKKEEEENKTQQKKIRDELINLPFLKSGVKITIWLKDPRKKIRIIIIGIIMALLLLFFSLSHSIFYSIIIGTKYNSISETLTHLPEDEENVDNEALDKEYQKMEDLLLLGDYITNTFVNIIYRIDIELYVLIIQSILFILYFKGQNFINDFFCHIFWGVLNKPYFSLILLANPLILYIFYQSETRIILNFFNVLLYSIISGCITFLFGTFCYLFFELPFKRLIRSFFNWDEQEVNKDDDEDDIYNNKDKDD